MLYRAVNLLAFETKIYVIKSDTVFVFNLVQFNESVAVQAKYVFLTTFVQFKI